MRPSALNPLFRSLDSLKGIGKALAPLVKRLIDGDKAVNLLWHLPTGRVDRRYSPKLAEALPGQIATLTVVVGEHRKPPPASRAPYRVMCHDDTGEIALIYFRAGPKFMQTLLPPGETVVISGRVESWNDMLQMPHPEHVVKPDEADSIRRVEPVYPLTAGVVNRVMVRLTDQVLASLPALPEWLDGPHKDREAWPDWKEAMETVHRPIEAGDLTTESPARRRLAYDELLASQLALLLVRKATREAHGRAIKGDGSLTTKVLAALPFSLTGAQQRATREIAADLAAEKRMLRLLQGDVGSGKTVVALLALLTAVESGAQACLMAPTEILARQHLETLAPLCAAAGVRIGLLTGRDKGKARQAILDDVASGALPLLIGTHALFQNDVAFADLALAVVDEQHRFGVHQRLALSRKGRAVDVLVMTATPIPRTLTLTHYGDMDVSRLDEKPPGREPVDTRALPVERLDDCVAAVARAVAQGSKVYWVCPVIEESEDGTTELAAAEARHAHLRDALGPRVGLVHGRLKGPEKDAVMEAFAGSELDVLVATTVIEVGVNVPTARIMVIEHAERFGLAQLHQLRGRIGRGTGKSTCLLLYSPPLGQVARERLKIMRDTEDGFVIAERDLDLRGAGEVLGTRQSGLPGFKLADVGVHGDLVATARADAAMVVETDPELQTARGQALRTLLYLFERDAAVLTLRSG